MFQLVLAIFNKCIDVVLQVGLDLEIYACLKKITFSISSELKDYISFLCLSNSYYLSILSRVRKLSADNFVPT